MSMSRKLKKKLIAAAAALTVFSAGAANVSAGTFADGHIQWGSASNDGTHYVTGGTICAYGHGTMIVVNQNTLINWDSFNVTGLQMFGTTSGVALVNQITANGHQSLVCTLGQASEPFNNGNIFIVSPYGVSYGGGTVSGINVIGSNTALITTMDQFNNFISGGVTPGPTPTPPGPVGPTPEEQAAAALRAAQESGRVVEALNLLDATRGNDSAVKAAQEALMNAQGDKEKQPTVNDSKLTGVQDHVYVVQTGAEQNTGLNIAKGLEGLTVKEASSRVRNISKQYLKALQDGDKAAAEQYKQQLKDANALVKALKEQEKNNSADEAAKALQGAQQGSAQGNQEAHTKPDNTADSANLKQLVEDLRNYTEQQKAAQKTTQETTQETTQTSSSGVTNVKELLEDLHKFVEEQKAKSKNTNARSFDETVTTAGEQKEPEGMKWFDNIIGEKLLTQEQNARNKLRNAKTSEERAAAMKELDEIHAEETKLVNEAMKQQEQAEQAAKQAAEQQARLEVQRRSDEQLKAIGGDALQSAIDHAARTRQAANGTAELLKSTKDLYEEADRACRQLSTQYWKEKEAGASPEKLEEINQKWQELNKIRNELKETVSQLWRNSNEAQQKADEAAALKERAQTLAEIGKIENQKTLDEKAQLEVSLAKALQEKAQADANLEAAKANADAADKALGDARKEKEAAQAAVDAWSDRYDREHGGAELQAKLDALDQRLESLQNQYADDSTTPEQADRINEEISRAYEEKESLEKAYLSEKEKAFENSAENRSLHEANERYDHALNDTGSVDKAENAAKDADKMVTYFQRKIDENQADIDNATKTFEDRLDPESAIRRAESDLALAKMREDAAAENLKKAKEENKNKAQREYDQAKDNTRQAMIAAGKASMLSKYDADAELSKLKAQQAKEQAANEQAARQGEEKPSAPPLSELLEKYGTEQQKKELQQQQQQGGETIITTADEQKDAGSKINDLIGTELLEKETTARNKLVKAKTSEEKAEAMKELDEVHKEETEKVNKLLKEQEEKQRIETMQQQLETQRKYEDQLKVVGGKEGGEALTRGAKRASDAVQKTKNLEKRIDELKKDYDETDKAARKLTDQYYKAKDAGASKEELEKIAKEWNELDQKRSELDKQRDNALVEHMNASDEAAKEAAEYSRLQGIAKEAQQEVDKLGLDKAKDDLAAKQAEYDRLSGRDIENGRDSAAEAAMKAVDDKYAAELQSLHKQYDEAINNGTSEDIERASSLLENKNMEVGMEKTEAANKAEEEYMTAERKELLQKLQSDKEAITQAEKNLNEAQQKVSNLEKVESAIREKAQDMLTAPDRINDAESAQIKAGVDAQVAALQHKSTEREYGFSSMEAGVTRSILNTSKDKYEAATANVNDLREKANYQPGQSANVFSATRQQTEAALKAGAGK